MNEAPDAADVGRVLAGDIEAYADIVRRWEGPLVTLAYRFCRDRHEAEEMAQTAFLKAFHGLRRWRGEGAFSSWLFAVATNVYRSHMRKRRPPVLPLDSARDVADPLPASSNGVDEAREALIRQEVSSLPTKYRDALLLFYFHDMDIREAALSLGIAEGTLKAQLHRGRELLRKRLGPLFDGLSEEGGTHD